MAKTSISRAQFLRGDYRGRDGIIRPPWSRAEHLFVEQCTRCDDCVNACPEGILKRGRGGFPQVDFSRGECSFCQECQKICRAPVFTPTSHRPWFHHIVIEAQCLTNQGVVCVACAEQCESSAIRFVARPGQVAQPQVSLSACNGCGACYRPCPAGAIRFQTSQPVPREQPSQRLEAYS